MRALLVLCILAAPLGWVPFTDRRRPAPRTGQGTHGAGPIDAAVVLDLLAVTLRSGVSIPRALDVVGDAIGPGEVAAADAAGSPDGPDGSGAPNTPGVGRDLMHAARALRRGVSWDAAWPDPEAPLPQALRSAWVDGADPQTLLEHAATRIRQGRKRAAREAAGALAVRLVLPLGLCLLPAFVLVGLVPVLIASGVGLFE